MRDDQWDPAAVVLARGTGHHDYPARFQLVAAMNPCRCGFLGSEIRACRCRRHERARYLSRLSGPLLDRFDLFVEVGPWKGAYLNRKAKPTTRKKTFRKTGGDWRQYPDGDHLAAARQDRSLRRAPAWPRCGCRWRRR